MTAVLEQPQARQFTLLGVTGAIVVLLTMVPFFYLLLQATLTSAVHLGTRTSWNVLHGVIVNTLVISISVAFLSCLSGFLMSEAVRMLPRSIAWLAIIVILAPMLTNQVARNSAWQLILDESGFLKDVVGEWFGLKLPMLIYNRFGVIVALTHGLLPLNCLVWFAGGQSVDSETVESAKACGVSAGRAYFRLYLPQLKTSLIVSLSLTLTLTLGYFITPAMLGGTDGIMIAKLVQQMLDKIGDERGAWLICCALSALAIPATWFLNKSFFEYYMNPKGKPNDG